MRESADFRAAVLLALAGREEHGAGNPARELESQGRARCGRERQQKGLRHGKDCGTTLNYEAA